MVNYPMGVITKGDDVQSDWAVAMAECLRDSDVQKKLMKHIRMYLNSIQVMIRLRNNEK